MTAAGLIAQKRLNELGRRWRIVDESGFKRIQPIMTVIAGALLGFLVTLTSVGAGALGAVMLAYLYPLRLTPARLVATDIVHAVPLALFAGLGHMFVGHVDFQLLGWLLIGSVPGVWLGARISSSIPQKYLRWALAIVLGSIGMRLTGIWM
ncbi:MAG: sulfite exporter TauE/SafE family protein [Betaproteobacteria bacterium]|nr:sulfite exporter TauE/SafE family protein [Betaproteobacteria bacterium]